MERFARNFEREAEGVYRCKTPAVFLLPNGHKIEVAPRTVLSAGTSFMGIDLATLLEEHFRRLPGSN